MLNSFKKFFLFLIFISITSFIFGYSYKIDSVSFDISGLTKESAMKNEIEIDTIKVFEDEESLLRYTEELKQRIINTRKFEEVEITYSENEFHDDDFTGISGVTLTVHTEDSFHLLILPYPLFSTSKGLSLKVKMKDTNFLGTLNTLDASLDFKLKPDSNGNQFRQFEPQLNFSYDFPFSFKGLDFIWTNSHSISYTWGESSPEWSFETGLTWIYPVKNIDFIVAFTQGFVRDLDYRSTDDHTYLSENLNFSTPLDIYQIPHHETIKFNPYVNFNLKFDPFKSNGYMGFKDNSLKGPALSTGGSFEYNEVNWNGNFRNGISVSVGPSISYNFASIKNSEISKFNLGLSMNLSAFKSYENIGFNARVWAFIYLTNSNIFQGSAQVDSYLRGIVDGRTSSHNSAKNQSETPVALVFNFDMPVHILTTEWENYKLTRKIKFMRYLNFELQMSPFVDIALIKTTKETHGEERLFDLRDGFYTAGLELLVFPQKWKGIEIRASVGFDVGNLLYGSLLNKEWRNKRDEGKMWLKTPEISIGLGLHY